jgi:predicted DNA-binding transcriptional regulator YafY
VAVIDTSARLLRLLSLLQSRPCWTGPELAERLEVTTRSVRRDVDRLRRLGYPVDATPGPEGGYRLGPGSELPPLQLDDDEAVAVWVALAAGLTAPLMGFHDAALAALGKLDRLLPPRLRPRLAALGRATVVLERPGEDAAAVGPTGLLVVARACTDRERLRLHYVDRRGQPSERRVDPYRLVCTGRRWYLVAFDVDRGEWRTLRMDRITEQQATGHRFERTDPPDAAELVSRSTTVAPYRYQMTVLFDTDADEVRRRIPPTVGLVERFPHGRARLTTGADSLAALAGHLIMVDLPFEVLEPPELRALLARRGAELVARHRS